MRKRSAVVFRCYAFEDCVCVDVARVAEHDQGVGELRLTYHLGDGSFVGGRVRSRLD